MVELAPAAEVITDVERFVRGDDSAYGGELLPDEPYEQWTLGTRARLRERRLAVMRFPGPLGRASNDLRIASMDEPLVFFAGAFGALQPTAIEGGEAGFD